MTNTPHHSTSIFYSIYLTLTQVPPPHPPFALLRRLCAGCPDPTPKPPEHKLNNNHTHYTPTNNITDESLYNHVITHYDYPAPLSPISIPSPHNFIDLNLGPHSTLPNPHFTQALKAIQTATEPGTYLHLAVMDDGRMRGCSSGSAPEPTLARAGG